MYLSEVTDRLYRSGRKQEEVELVRIDLFEKYPDIEAEAFSQSMSTIPVDPEVPDEWVRFVFNGAFKRRKSTYLENPTYGSISETDKDELVRKVKKLLPDPSTIDDPKERKSVENRITRAEAKIRQEANVGLTVSPDNTKLGKVTNFSLPAGNNFRLGACPGATETCENLCYAKGALFQMNEWRYFVNWAFVQLWPDRFVEAWKTIDLSKVVRVHAGGDFYSEEYIDLWLEVAKNRPETRFYAYTRSWQDGRGSLQSSFIEHLDALSKADNWRLILSLDKDTGTPPKHVVPLAFRAWLATEDSDLPSSRVGLIFRDHDGMQSVAPMMGGSPVCPVERSADYTKASGKITCQNCGFCWSTGHLMYDLRSDNPSQFDKYAKVDIAARTAMMFRGVGTPTPEPVANPTRATRGVSVNQARRGTPEFDALMEELEDDWELDNDELDNIVEVRRAGDSFEIRLKGEDEWELLEDDEDDEEDSGEGE